MPTAATPTAAPQPRLRPVQPDDLAAMRRFVCSLSPDTRALRFHGGVKPDSQRLLAHLTQADGRRHIALVAVLPCDDGELIVGEARCLQSGEGAAAEFALVVADAWQGRGLARRLLAALLAAAAEAGIRELAGDVLAHNARMASFMQREGFNPQPAGDADVLRWQRPVAPRAANVALGFLGFLRWRSWLSRLSRTGRLGPGLPAPQAT